MSDIDEESTVLLDGTYNKEYRRLRTLSSRTDIRQVSVSGNLTHEINKSKKESFCWYHQINELIHENIICFDFSIFTVENAMNQHDFPQ